MTKSNNIYVPKKEGKKSLLNYVKKQKFISFQNNLQNFNQSLGLVRKKVRKKGYNNVVSLLFKNLKIKKKKYVKIQLKKNFTLNFSYYTFVREFASFKLTQLLDTHKNNTNLSSF